MNGYYGNFGGQLVNNYFNMGANFFPFAHQHQQLPVMNQQAPVTPDPMLVLPHLLIGGVAVYQNPELLYAHGVTHVLNLATEVEPDARFIAIASSKNILYKKINIDQGIGYDIGVHFREAFEFIDHARENNGRVLVNCLLGASRSTTIVIAYLMNRLNMSLQQVYAALQPMRTPVTLNPTHVQSLQKFEMELSQSKYLLSMPRQNNFLAGWSNSPVLY